MPPYETVNPPSQASKPLAVRGERTGKRHWWIWLIIFGVVALGWCYGRSRGAQANGRAGAVPGAPGRGGAPGSLVVPVVVATAHKGDLPVYFNGLGTVTAFNTVTVRSRVDGQIVKVNFTEGQYVKEGDSLIEIDPRPFQVQLEQAEGQLAKDQAQLRADQRPRGVAPDGRGQHCACHGYHRTAGDHTASTDLGDLHLAAGPAAASDGTDARPN